jgi:protein TonB
MTTRTPLGLYLEPAADHDRGRTLANLMGLCLLVSTGLGLLMLTVEAPPVLVRTVDQSVRVTFHAPTTPEPPSPPRPEPVVAEAAPEPVDLTEPVVLAQAVDLPAIAPDPTDAPAATAAEPEPAPPVRRVYGVRKVLARGLGSGASNAGAGLVVKRGNTLDGVADELEATPDDLRGQLAALSTVDRAPVPEHRVKPRYSEALLAARATGTVTARVLVDREGAVAAVVVTEDIGHDSADVAAEALRQFRFRPALRHGEPVAVWIIHRIRVEFQE